MLRSISIALSAAAAVAVAACGAEGGPAVEPGTAKAQVERAAHVRLVEEAVPADAREQGMRASYSNAATAAKDRQAVALFVMKDEEVVEKVSGMVRDSAPKAARLIVNGAVMVVYAPAGRDHSPAVKRAIDAL